MEQILATWESVVLLVTVTVVGAAGLVGLIARTIARPKWLVRLHEAPTQDVVERVIGAMGLDDVGGELARKRAADAIASAGSLRNYRERLNVFLEEYVVRQRVHVGQGYKLEFPYFIDFQSATLDRGVADALAAILASFLNDVNRRSDVAVTNVVGLKGGSPFLAEALARKLRARFAQHRGAENSKWTDGSSSSTLRFDGDLRAGERAVIVDDSTTGGRMMLDCIEDLRASGCHVEYALVLFEPLGKGARAALGSVGVELLSVAAVSEAGEFLVGSPSV